MKTFILLISLLFINGVQSEDKTPEGATWYKLSALCQNIGRQLSKYGPGGGLDPSAFSEDAKALEVLLDRLIKSGELKERNFEMRNPSELDGGGFEKLVEFADGLTEKYGAFVAMELMDLGLARHLSTIDPGAPFVLHVKLPEKELNKFALYAKEHKLLKPK